MSAAPSPSGGAASLTGAALTGAAKAVLPALAEAAQRTGVDFNALFQTARVESGFNPSAKARTSSAAGLFQFIDSTWLSTVARHGARHGILPASRSEALALRNNPEIASLMAGEHMADNAQALQAKLGRAVDTVDLYLAHFLGAGGAGRFLERLAKAPDTAASELLPSAARANRSIFFDKGAPRSLQQVHDLLARKLGGARAAPAPVAEAVQPAGSNGGSGSTMAALLAATEGRGQASDADSSALSSALGLQGPDGRPQPAQAARLAYLLLAELGA